MLISREGVSRGTLVDEQPSHNTANGKSQQASLVAELDFDDLYEPPSANDSPTSKKATHFQDVCAQMLADHQERPRTRVFLQVVARIFGVTFARCLSNVIAFFTGKVWLDPRRDYAVLPSNAKIYNAAGEPIKIDGAEVDAEKLAQIYKPKMYTISEDQAADESMRPVEMRYEVLPPRTGKNNYSIIYYVRREREYMPVIFLGVLLDLVRPLFWSTKSEWSAVEVDINRETGQPDKIICEASNYTGDPLSYEITSANDLHLPVKAVLKNKKWMHTIVQKNSRGKTRDIGDPFLGGTHPQLVFVNWNGSIDLLEAASKIGYGSEGDGNSKKLYSMADVPLKFLDIRTYRKEGLDLRNHWLKRRKTGHCILNLSPRKDPKEFKVVSLVSGELPSLLQNRTS